MKEEKYYYDNYNTKLGPNEALRYQKWAGERWRDEYDYDLKGYWLDIADKEGIELSKAHGPDTYKKPNHPTFSTQSKYSNDLEKGGEWIRRGDRDVFVAGAGNRANMSKEQMEEYWLKAETDDEGRFRADLEYGED